MNRIRFSELMRLSMGIESQDRRAMVDDRVLWSLGDMVRGKMIDDYIKVSQSKGEFIKHIIVDVQKDTVRDKKYVDVGGVLLNLRDNQGFVSISKIQGDDTPFTIVNAGTLGLTYNLECSEIGTVTWQEGERWYFNELPPEVEQVMLIGIPTIASLSDSENIPVPYGKEDEWFDKTKAKLFPAQPEDKSGSDTRQQTV